MIKLPRLLPITRATSEAARFPTGSEHWPSDGDPPLHPSQEGNYPLARGHRTAVGLGRLRHDISHSSKAAKSLGRFWARCSPSVWRSPTASASKAKCGPATGMRVEQAGHAQDEQAAGARLGNRNVCKLIFETCSVPMALHPGRRLKSKLASALQPPRTTGNFIP